MQRVGLEQETVERSHWNPQTPAQHEQGPGQQDFIHRIKKKHSISVLCYEIRDDGWFLSKFNPLIIWSFHTSSEFNHTNWQCHKLSIKVISLQINTDKYLLIRCKWLIFCHSWSDEWWRIMIIILLNPARKGHLLGKDIFAWSQYCPLLAGSTVMSFVK